LANIDDKVIDSREAALATPFAAAVMPEMRAGSPLRTIDEIPYMVIKKDGVASVSSGKRFCKGFEGLRKTSGGHAQAGIDCGRNRKGGAGVTERD